VKAHDFRRIPSDDAPALLLDDEGRRAAERAVRGETNDNYTLWSGQPAWAAGLALSRRRRRAERGPLVSGGSATNSDIIRAT
jgi:hypothetical protein